MDFRGVGAGIGEGIMVFAFGVDFPWSFVDFAKGNGGRDPFHLFLHSVLNRFGAVEAWDPSLRTKIRSLFYRYMYRGWICSQLSLYPTRLH